MTHDTTPPGTAVPDPYAVPAPLDLGTDVVDLTAAVCDVASVSGDETRLADAVEGRQEAELAASGLLGSFRREMGWKNAKPRGTGGDLSYRIFESGSIVP